jgi:inosine-uridine nucleoside N-ribohydrolase
MRSSELKIEAITAVAGNVPLSFTLPNALRMVEIANRTEIPVAGGASEALIRRLTVGASVHGSNGLGGVEFPAPRITPVKEQAADLICRIVRENPGQITIVGIGPLTNIALAFRQDPDVAKLARRVVLMGGSLSGGNATPAAEFNFYADPEAASIVFDSNVSITMIGLDVTEKVALTDEHIRRLESGKGKVGNAVARIAKTIIDRHMHDPLAICSLIIPEIFVFEDYHVEIETSGDITAGESVGWKRGPLSYSAPLQSVKLDERPTSVPFRANTRVATGIHPDKFFELFISRLTDDRASNG